MIFKECQESNIQGDTRRQKQCPFKLMSFSFQLQTHGEIQDRTGKNEENQSDTLWEQKDGPAFEEKDGKTPVDNKLGTLETLTNFTQLVEKVN